MILIFFSPLPSLNFHIILYIVQFGRMLDEFKQSTENADILDNSNLQNVYKLRSHVISSAEWVVNRVFPWPHSKAMLLPRAKPSPVLPVVGPNRRGGEPAAISFAAPRSYDLKVFLYLMSMPSRGVLSGGDRAFSEKHS